MTTTINFYGDIKMDAYWRKWTTETVFEVVRQTKGGLYILRAPDGTEHQLPKRNILALNGGKA